jgi:hypothetical protein
VCVSLILFAAVSVMIVVVVVVVMLVFAFVLVFLRRGSLNRQSILILWLYLCI